MAEATVRRRPRTRALVGAGAAVAVTALVATLAVVWPGFDAQETPLDDGTVWAVQTGQGEAYARVNLELGELDTVKTAENASSLAQTDDQLFVFSDSDSQFADVDMATPRDLTAATTDAFTRTPAGTVEVDSAGDFLIYRTDAGGVWTATLSDGGAPRAIDPYADVEVAEGEDRPRFAATAVTIDAEGIAFVYSSAEGRVLRADASTGRILGEDPVAAPPADVQLTTVGERWLLLDEATGDLRVRGRDEPIPTPAGAGAVLQRAATAGSDAYLADAEGLVRASLDAGTAERTVSQDLGVPAAPLTLDDTTYAAWLGEDGTGGELWTSQSPTLNPLDYGSGTLGELIDPVFVTNGTRVALNERSSGWVWTVPAGALVASSQQWALEETVDTSRDDDTVADRVIEPKPPVAVDDDLGVRAGSVVRLPVLLNDHDPNEDVLSIDAASVTGLDPAFGTVAVTGQEQTLAVDVAPDATGSATFRYRVTDGTSSDGLYSPEATVTLTVVPPDVNRPPAPCDPDDCLAERPRPTVVPGGTVTVDALYGWVDPDGDPFYLADVENETGIGTAAGQPDGTLTYQHPDPQAAEAVDVELSLTVADSRGATTSRSLTVAVTPAPRLTADSFAVVGVAGVPLSIDVRSRVSGTTGAALLSGAVVLDEGAATVTANAAALSMEFAAETPGTYLTQYTVRDDVGEETGTVRVTLRDPADTAISTPPLTAFVRPNEDATVDVFPAVSNPAGRVLLLSDLRPESAGQATLSVDLVGRSSIRLSGSTDDGAPGLLGVVRYTVSDGTGSPAASAEGELSVILLGSPESDPPIAVDDTVTVRAGAQIDIPVLTNDSAPAAALISVDPSTIVNENEAGLAFATSRLVRYLAPEQPGVYGIGYSIFRLGFPDAVDSARITVTVVGDEANRAPLPRTLEGRVLSGASVRIPFDRFGVDPDGDAVTLDAILTQPAEGGSATIAAEGDAIVYTSPERFSGQDSFRYRVRDAEGAVGEAEVRIGVLAAESDPSPVTFSDYLQIQVGATSTAVVRPADNDVDPSGSALTVESVVPNAPEGSDEYAALADLLGPLEDGEVTVRAGETPGTSSYIYTVRNATGDTAQGLIVVKAVPMPVPDYPVVADTTLTAETREAFPAGVDVLTGKVAWSTGDPERLTLSLWGSPPGIEVSGTRISGPIPEESLLIPFRVSGTSFDGSEVVSYGFLRVPGDRDVRLSLREGTRIDVRENEAQDLDLASAIAVPAGRTLEVAGPAVRAGGARADATCAVVSGTTVRYTAGADAPWTDTCIVPVKLDVQDEFTFLTVPVAVEAEDPEPILRSASITVGPGQSAEYDLTSMVGWAGREDWDALRFDETYRGDQFEVTRAGTTLTVTAVDAARPGREEAVAVSLPSHPDAPPAALNLTVGPAPSELPKGGTARQTCSQSGGTASCTITVIGVSGEINPLPGTPLALVSVGSPRNCPGVEFAKAGATSVRASWSADTPGAADCTASFVVSDAQGRASAGDRNGTLLLDLQGLPAAPASLDWIAYSADSVTLRVISDASSYPAVDGFRITSGGRLVATCDAAGTCPAISAEAGEPVTYEARAFSDVGESRTGVQVSAWAYAAPAAPTGAIVDPVPNGTAGGVATITVTGIDPSTGSVTLSGGAAGDVTLPVRGSSVTFQEYGIGSNSPTSLTATPLTRFELPPIAGGSQAGDAYAFRANGIGAPRLTLDVTASRSANPGTVTATATVAPDGTGDRILVGFSIDGTCTPDQVVDAAGGTASRTFADREVWREVTVTACAVTERSSVPFGRVEKTGSATPTEGIPAPGASSYAISRSGDLSWERVEAPALSNTAFYRVFYRSAAVAKTDDFASLFADRLGEHPGEIQAFFCVRLNPSRCGDPVTVTPAPGAQYTARVSFPTQCRSEDTAAPTPTVRANPGDYQLVVADPVADENGVVTWMWTLTWQNRLADFEDVSRSLTCAPPPPSEPEPEPEPDPEP